MTRGGPELGRSHPAASCLWRFVSGQPLDGRRRTDSQFLHAGTRSLIGLQHPSRWSMLPGWRRALRRLQVTFVLAGAAWLYATGHRAYLAWSAAVVSVAAAALLGFRAWRGVCLWRHRREWVKPLHAALARPLELSPSMPADSYLSIPLDLWSNESAEVRVALPEGFNADAGTRQLVAELVATKLAIPDAEPTWRLAGAAPALVIRQAPQPPQRVTFADLREHMEAAASSAPVLGLGIRGIPQAVDLDAESPHVGLSMSSGGGKSVTSRTVGSQILNRGGLVVVLDLKRVSHMWTRGIPGVAYCRDIASIHDALITLAAEGDRRFRVIETLPEDTVLDEPPVFVIVEEVNATLKRLKRYWSDIRGKDDPKESPAVQALADGLFLGRQARMHYMLIAQLLTAAALGGPEVRELIFTRILARYTKNAARMLAPDVTLPPAVDLPGRAQIVRGGKAAPVQIGFLTSLEAREWATAGQRALGLELPVGATPAELVSLAQPARARLSVVPAYGTAPALEAAPAVELLPLSAACAPGGVLERAGVKLASARKAVQRDPEFPEPAGAKGVTQLYSPAALERWVTNRPRAIAGKDSTVEAG